MYYYFSTRGHWDSSFVVTVLRLLSFGFGHHGFVIAVINTTILTFVISVSTFLDVLFWTENVWDTYTFTDILDDSSRFYSRDFPSLSSEIRTAGKRGCYHRFYYRIRMKLKLAATQGISQESFVVLIMSTLSSTDSNPMLWNLLTIGDSRRDPW